MREKRREEEAGRSKKEQERERSKGEKDEAKLTQCTSLGVSYTYIHNVHIGLLWTREQTTMGSVWWMKLVLLLTVRMSTSAGLAYTWTLSG